MAASEYIACVHPGGVRIDSADALGELTSLNMPADAGLSEVEVILNAHGWHRVSDWVIEDGHAHARLVSTWVQDDEAAAPDSVSSVRQLDISDN